MIEDDQPRERTATLECFPKDFSLADPKRNNCSTKGTMFFMSPCGAKILCTEMISSESMSCLFHSLSRWVPIVQPRLREIMKDKMNRNREVTNPRTKETGAYLNLFSFQSEGYHGH